MSGLAWYGLVFLVLGVVLGSAIRRSGEGNGTAVVVSRPDSDCWRKQWLVKHTGKGQWTTCGSATRLRLGCWQYGESYFRSVGALRRAIRRGSA